MAPKNDAAMMGIFDGEVLDAMAADNAAKKGKKPIDTEKEARLAQKEARLQAQEQRRTEPEPGPRPTPAKVASAPPPPPPAQMDKSGVLDKIEAYRKRFPHLRARNKLSIKSTPEELRDELHYIEMQLGSSDGSGGMGMMMFITSMNVVETVTETRWNPLNLQLQGLTEVCKDNQDTISPIIDELMIKYATSMHVGPEMRLVMTVGAMMATVHAANSGNVQVAETLQRASKTVSVPKDSESL